MLKRSSRKVVNPLSVALRLAARTLRNSHSALGANFRRLIAKIGMPKAITAMARKLAVLVYRMLKYGTQYVDKGMQHYESKYQETKLQYLRAQAAKLGMILLPKQAAVRQALPPKTNQPVFGPKPSKTENITSSSLSARSTGVHGEHENDSSNSESTLIKSTEGRRVFLGFKAKLDLVESYPRDR